MRDRDLDRVLGGEDDIVPSSGFAMSVMEAVRREAATPPPIPPPWTRALPGLAAWVMALAGAVGVSIDRLGRHTVPPGVIWAITQASETARSTGAGWVALALLLSLLSMVIAMRLSYRRS